MREKSVGIQGAIGSKDQQVGFAVFGHRPNCADKPKLLDASGFRYCLRLPRLACET